MDPNITDLQTQTHLQYDWFAVMIYGAVAFVMLSIASNSFTLVVLRSSKVFSEIDLILYRLLAFEDMISSIVGLTTVVLFDNEDYRRLALPFFIYCMIPFCYQTIGIVLSIGICRYLMIVRPLHYPMWVTRKRIIVAQSVLILMSFVLTSLLTLLTEYFEERNSFYYADSIYMIPIAFGFLVQVFTGSHMLYISVTQSRRLRRIERAVFHQEHRQNGNGDPGDPDNPEAIQEPKRRLPSSLKGLKTVLVITGSYWVAWFPMVLNAFYEMRLLELPDWFIMIYTATICINNCWNPLIYYLTNTAFRDAANRTIRRMKSKICQLCKRHTVAVVE